MSIEFRTTKPAGVPPMTFVDNANLHDITIRTSDLPKGVDTTPLGPYDPKDGRGYQVTVNIAVLPTEISLSPGRTKKPQAGLVLKNARFGNGLPAKFTYGQQAFEGSFYPVSPTKTTDSF